MSDETRPALATVPGTEVPGPLMTPEARVTALEARIAALEAGRDAETRRADQAERDLEAFRRKVGERMADEARERGWCSDFDDIMQEFGLGEFVLRDVEVDINFTVTVPNVSLNGPSQGDVDDAAMEFIRCHLDSSHWTIVD